MSRAARPQAGVRLQPQTSRSATSRTQIVRLEEEASARSARTQRSIRSSRGRPRAGCVVYGVPYGIVGKWHLIEYRDDTIKHATSPSRHDCSQQVVISRVFQIQSIAIEHKKSFSRFAAASFSPFVNTPTNTSTYASPSRDCCSYLSCSKRARRDAPPEKFRHRTTALILL